MQRLKHLAANVCLIALAVACTSATPSTTPTGGGGSTNQPTSAASTREDEGEDAAGGSGEETASETSKPRGGSSSTLRSGSSSGVVASSNSQSNAGGSSSEGQSQRGGNSAKSKTSVSGSSSGDQTSAGGASSSTASSAGGSSSASTSSASGGISVSTTVPIGSPHTGEITFYDDVGDGTCMFGVTGEVDVAALAIGSWDSANWCGACADVTGPKGTVRVRVVNQCPSCGGTWDLDLNRAAFLKIQDEEVGRYSTSWNFVACNITTPVTYRFKEGSSPGWVGVLVNNLNLPITKFEWSKDEATWTEAQRQSYNYFESASGFGPNYVYVRITAVDGQVLNDRLPVARPALVVTGSANFE